MKYFLVLTLLFSGCMKNNTAEKYFHYFNDFNSDLISLGFRPLNFQNVVIEESDIHEQAKCMDQGIRFYGETAHIKVSKYFNYMNWYHQKMIIYHEIGHCYFGLDHSQEKTYWIMTPNGITNYFSEPQVSDNSLRISYVKDLVASSIYSDFY